MAKAEIKNLNGYPAVFIDGKPYPFTQAITVRTHTPDGIVVDREYFEKLGKTPKIIEISGATEITPRLGLSDVVVDITSSGSTLKSNKLRNIKEELQ